MVKELRDLTERTKEEFQIKDAAARVEERKQQKAKEEAAKAETGRFLEATFPQRGTASDHDEDKVIAVGSGSHYDLGQIATSLGLFTGYFRAQVLSLDQPLGDWVIVGRNGSAVEKKIVEFKKAESDKEKEFERAKKRKQEQVEEFSRMKRQKVLDEAGKSKNWDVTGSWEISCLGIEENWSTEQLTLEIYSEKTAKGSQMFAKFDFGILEGIFRFERRENVPETKVVRADARKRNNNSMRTGRTAPRYYGSNSLDLKDEDEGRDGLEAEIRSDSRSPTPDAFYLDSATWAPSPENPSLSYRWRGEETGEGEIHLFSDKRAYEISFGEPMGTTLKGVIGSDYFDDCEFTGVKMGIGHPSKIDISAEWANRNDVAYERARVGRWGGWSRGAF